MYIQNTHHWHERHITYNYLVQKQQLTPTSVGAKSTGDNLSSWQPSLWLNNKTRNHFNFGSIILPNTALPTMKNNCITANLYMHHTFLIFCFQVLPLVHCSKCLNLCKPEKVHLVEKLDYLIWTAPHCRHTTPLPHKYYF